MTAAGSSGARTRSTTRSRWASPTDRFCDSGAVTDADADALAEVDAIFDRFHARGLAPGLAFGVVIDGRLVHSGGRGTLRVGADAPPDADSVFRIASMTKSFTAAAVLLLRDEGRLRLDDPVAAWVPDLDGRLRPTADSRPVTIEDLLTMSAGLADR